MTMLAPSRPDDTLTRHMLCPFINAGYAVKSPPRQRVGARSAEFCRRDGVLIRDLADPFIISPPLILTRPHVDGFDRAVGAVETA